MSTIRVDTITDEAGTGAPNFPNGATGLPDPFGYTAVSGATQALDVGSHNFFDAGTLTADTTVSFSNVPTEARWSYSFKAGVDEGYVLSLATLQSIYDMPQNGFWTGHFFKPDGTKIYITDQDSDAVFQFTLLTAWDLSTASYDSVSFSVAAQDVNPNGVFFKPDGTKMYIIGYSSDRIYQYTLSTAWDLNTASYDSVSFSCVAQENTPMSVFFKPDGTKMYLVGWGGQSIYQYTLSTAWVVSSASYDSVSFNVAGQSPSTTGVFFSNDGTKMFVCGVTNTGVYEYTLSTAWAVNTASYASVFFSIGGTPQEVSFSENGEKMFVLRSGNQDIVGYGTSAYTSLTLPSSVVNPPYGSLTSSERVSFNFWTSDGGTTVNYGSAF